MLRDRQHALLGGNHSRCNEHQPEIERLKSQLSTKTAIIDDTRCALAGSKLELARIEGELIVESEAQEASAYALKKREDVSRDALRDRESELQLVHSELASLKDEFSSFVSCHNALKREMADLLAERSEFVEARVLIRQKLERETSVVEANKDIARQLDSEYDQSVRANSDTSAVLCKLRDNEFSDLESLKQLHCEISRYESSRESLRKRIKTARNLLDASRSRMVEIAESISQVSSEIASTHVQNGALEESYQSLVNSSDLKQLDTLKLQRRLGGISQQYVIMEQRQAELYRESQSLLRERSAIALEAKQCTEHLQSSETKNREFQSELRGLNTNIEHLQSELSSISKTTQTVKRTHMQSPARPFLIESASPLIERYQVNIFLRESQSHLHPVPILVGKLAELLLVLRDRTFEREKQLHQLTEANAAVCAVRNRSSELSSAKLDLEDFKRKTYYLYIENLMAESGELILDSLQISPTDFSSISRFLIDRNTARTISALSLHANCLDDTCVRDFLEITRLSPNMSRLNISGNAFSVTGISLLVEGLECLDGITRVHQSPWPLPHESEEIIVTAWSGNLARLQIAISSYHSKSRNCTSVPLPVVASRPTENASGLQSSLHFGIHMPNGFISPAPHVHRKTELSMRIPSLPVSKKPVMKARETHHECRVVSSSSTVSDSSFRRDFNVTRRKITDKASRLGLKY
jgi:hypothetical protein